MLGCLDAVASSLPAVMPADLLAAVALKNKSSLADLLADFFFLLCTLYERKKVGKNNYLLININIYKLDWIITLGSDLIYLPSLSLRCCSAQYWSL